MFISLSILIRRLSESTRDDRGQATAEYALVILGAAALALLVIGWAANTSAIGDLFDAVIDSVASRVG